MTVGDVGVVVTLVMLEVILSLDNAVVLALVARRLSSDAERSRAMTIGISLSFGMRLVGLLLASTLIKLWYLRAVGGLYLCWLCASHFISAARSDDKPKVESPPQFSKVVALIALTDIAFAGDTILVAVAATSKLWLIYIAVFLGTVALRFVSGSCMKILERYPTLDHVAYALVGWAGLRLVLDAAKEMGSAVFASEWQVGLPAWVFWTGMAVIIVVGGARSMAFRPKIVETR